MTQVTTCPHCHAPALVGHTCEGMTSPLLTELERRRLEVSRDCTKATPEQILRFALDDLRNDGIAYDAAFVILIKKSPESDEGKTARYRAGLRKREEIAYLALAQSFALDEWKR